MRLFGDTVDEQRAHIQQEERAWFDLLDSKTIVDTVNMCPTFIENTSTPNNAIWLQTVSLI